MVPKKVSIGKKFDLPVRISPGPSCYQINHEVSAKNKKSAFVKIGTTKRVEIFVSREDEPGPALYSSTESFKKNQGRTFGLKPKEILIESPGPSSYSTDIKSPMKHGVIPSARKEDFWTPEDKINSPGPQSYNTSAGIVPRKVSMGGKFKEIKFLTPGPGAFELRSPLKHSST